MRYFLVRGGVEVVEVVVVWVVFVVLELELVLELVVLWVRERPGVVWEDMVSGMIVINAMVENSI